MGSIAEAQAEWESATVAYPLSNRRSDGEMVIEPFRRYENAIAWWNGMGFARLRNSKL
jgi:hypothetical protein